ncbi:MAG: EamA family transporter [Deltaproteobacteria bacterium]|nr:EamA family transporter [Deltaproteobacteria bacterium]
MAIVGLVLFSAFLHAGWNALLRVEPDKDRGLVGAICVAALFACVIAAIRWGLGDQPFATTESMIYTAVAGGFEAVYFATLALAMDRGRLGPVYTVSRGGAVLVVWPLSIILFDELVTVSSTTGSGMVLCGLILAGLGAHHQSRGAAGKGASGIGWATLCAASIAGYHLSYKAALLDGGSASATFGVSLALAAVIRIVWFGRSGRTALIAAFRSRPWRIVLMGLVCGGSFLILMEALALGGSGYVLTLRNTSVLFAALLAWAIGERPVRAELIGAALVAFGAVVMSL